MTEHNSFPAQALFQPQSVAVVGVPRGPKVGQIFLQGLLHPGYKGRIYPINPNADEVLGLRLLSVDFGAAGNARSGDPRRRQRDGHRRDR